MKTIMFYEMAPDGLSKAMAHIDGHKARLKIFHERGVLLMAGPFANPGRLHNCVRVREIIAHHFSFVWIEASKTSSMT